MIAEAVAQRLRAVAVLPETVTALQRLVAQDELLGEDEAFWAAMIPTIYHLVGGVEEECIRSFAAAWSVVYTATRRLDHQEDGDRHDQLPLGSPTAAAQYNLLLAYYVLAMALLDDARIPPSRFQQLLRLWNDSMLVAASGQQRDLAGETERRLELDSYQQTIHAKAGAIFALAFGGAALLGTDDQPTIAALTTVGQLYGALRQYSDDLYDAAMQPSPALTFPQVYQRARLAQTPTLLNDTVEAFWQHVYAAYLAHVEQALAPLSTEIQTTVRHVFTTTFEEQPRR